MMRMFVSTFRHLRQTAAALIFAATAITLLPLTTAAAPQPQREHLTPQEIEMVRNSQELDKRTLVFIKAAERRLLFLTDPQSAQSKQMSQEIEKWGAIPQSTRAQLLSDLARILDEAITNIDDAALHNASSPLINKAIKQLSEASTRFQAQIAPMRDRAAEGPEREFLERAIDELEEIIEAAKKVPDVKTDK